MIDYEEFVKLPIFKKGWICFDHNKYLLWFKNKPRFTVRWGWWSDGDNIVLDGIFDFKAKGIKEEDSLRKVGRK